MTSISKKLYPMAHRFISTTKIVRQNDDQDNKKTFKKLAFNSSLMDPEQIKLQETVFMCPRAVL